MPRPHHDYTFVKRAAEVTGTGDIIWDPPDGKRFVITEINLNATAAATVTIFDDVDDINNNADLRVFKGSLAANDTVGVHFHAWPSAQRNNRLKGTTDAGTVYVEVVGYETD